MLKRSFAILSIVLGVVAFLVGCSKSSHDTLAFIGDETEMKSCYDIYPQQYFPSEISASLKEGRFPPDIVGEYEMNGMLVDAYYEYWNSATHQYVPYQPQVYQQMQNKSMRIIVSEQVNGMAKIKFASRRNSNTAYKIWYEADAYIYGDVFSETPKDFVIYCDNTQDGGSCKYDRGNIIKGTIDESGIVNIKTWSVIKNYTLVAPMTLNKGGFECYHADLAKRQ